VDIRSRPVLSHRILIAEDNALNQKILRRMLESISYGNLVFVDTGREAVRQVEEYSASGHPFHVVLMDIMMPVMDGAEAARLIRALQIDCRPAILALTADVTQEQRQRCLEAGMEEYLTKPIRLQQLQEALARHCALAAETEMPPGRLLASPAPV
jgi:CheY-like chemotaxis protein